MPHLSPDTISEILSLVEGRQGALLRNLFPSLHPADLADLLDGLGTDDRSFLFDLLPESVRSDVLVELDQRSRAELVEDMSDEALADVIRPLDSDDAADVLGELDDPVRETVLDRLEPADAADLRELLTYDPESAGGLMAAEFIALQPDQTVGDAVRVIREQHESVPHLRIVYLVDPGMRVMGVVPLRHLVISDSETRLTDVGQAPRLTVPSGLDQEEVAEQFRRYDAIESAVVDGEGKMLGVITIDDVVDVIREEVEEDLGYMSGTGGESASTDSVLHATRRRLPWLLVGLLGGLLAAWALSRYELSLKKLVSLAFFVPVINAMGGNVAMQSSSIAVRALALGSNAYRALGRRMWREFLVSVLNGLACAVLLAAMVQLWLGDVRLSALVGGALFAVILIATSVGAIVPVVLHRLRIDPALAAGPFVTTANDVLGILVYLSLADLLLGGAG